MVDKTVVNTRRISDLENDGHTGSGISIVVAVVNGVEADFGKVFRFSDSSISVGRAGENLLTLNDARVSGHHCLIGINEVDDMGQIYIEDLDSTNGTFVNGESVKRRILKSGDKISLGETVLKFTINDEVEEKYLQKLFNLASIDSLTGLFNKRHMLRELETQARIAARNGRTFSVLLLDIDKFKQLNDTYGHVAGDEYLHNLAVNINLSLREQDIAGRFGGEEFIIILPETMIEGSVRVAERLRINVENSEVISNGNSIKTTISLGIAQYGVHDTAVRGLLEKADEALYKAKNGGRNQVVVAE